MRVIDDPGEQKFRNAITSTLERKNPGLQFPSILEERFELNRRFGRIHHLQACVLIALAVYDLFLICDYNFLRDHFERCVVLRLGIVTPMIFVTYLWLQGNPRKGFRESLTLAESCIVSFTTLYLWHGVNGVATAFAQGALVLIILFVNTMMRLRFVFALASTCLCLAEGAAFLSFDPYLTLAEKATCLSLAATGGVFSLVANYWMEREERRSYLLHLQLVERGAELAQANRELTRVSSLDALTGLPNRRHFSETYAEIWRNAVMMRQPLSLMLIDIDHFKKINDEFGHIQGDEVLVRVGRALKNCLRDDDDAIARFGGEEFVVLLPGLELEEALIVAERLRMSAGTVEIGSLDAAVARRMTVSIGVASTRPLNLHQREQLLRDADLALYEAKTSGRDCVRPATIPGNEAEQQDPWDGIGLLCELEGTGSRTR